MSYLLRVELPDVPGSLGLVASAVGSVGGNINAIEIVDKRDQRVVDDVFLEADPRVMPDSIVSACNRLDGVRVLWISRYAGAGTLFLDLEAVEAMTEDPRHALDRLVDLIPTVFRVDWGMRVRREGNRVAMVRGSAAAPTEIPDDIPWVGGLERGRRVDSAPPYEDWLLAACPSGPDEAVVMARHGGPELLDSEVARFNHLSSLAASLHGSTAT